MADTIGVCGGGDDRRRNRGLRGAHRRPHARVRPRGAAAATALPERVVGMHFFNPPRVMRLVEVVSGQRTARRGRRPSPSPRAGMVLGLNHPRRPLEWCDAIGAAEVLTVLRALHDEYAEERYRPAPRAGRRRPPRRRGIVAVMRLAPAIALLASCALLPAADAGAYAVPGAAFAESLQKTLRKATKVRVLGVSCPESVEKRKGERFRCRVRFASGDRTPVRVVLRDDEGHYRANIVYLLLRRIERQLERMLASKNVDADVRCPKRRKVRKGDEFICRTKGDDGSEAVFELTQVGNGLVHYELRSAA